MSNERTQLISAGRSAVPFILSLLALGWLIFPTLQGIAAAGSSLTNLFPRAFAGRCFSGSDRSGVSAAWGQAGHPLWLPPFILALIGYGLGDIGIQAIQQIVVALLFGC